MGSVIIRPARAGDAHEIARIHRQAITIAMPWLPRLHTSAEDLRFFTDEVLPKQSVFVADVAKQVVGFIAFDEGWVHHLYLAPDRWRQGIGGRLLQQAKESSTSLQLWTFERNQAARDFYALHGFCEVEKTDGRHNEEQTPDVRLEWKN